MLPENNRNTSSISKNHKIMRINCLLRRVDKLAEINFVVNQNNPRFILGMLEIFYVVKFSVWDLSLSTWIES